MDRPDESARQASQHKVTGEIVQSRKLAGQFAFCRIELVIFFPAVGGGWISFK